jgi:alpha-galactosidase
MKIFCYALIEGLLVVAGACSMGAQTVAGGSYPQLAKTPPMGWNSWNKFACDVREQLIRETADAMVSSGMLAAGYRLGTVQTSYSVEVAKHGVVMLKVSK